MGGHAGLIRRIYLHWCVMRLVFAGMFTYVKRHGRVSLVNFDQFCILRSEQGRQHSVIGNQKGALVKHIKGNVVPPAALLEKLTPSVWE